MKMRAILACFLMLAGVSASQAEEVHRLTALDLAAQTYRWDNKLVEMEARCFSAHTALYRCVTDTGTRIDLANIYPPEARTIIDKDCDTLSKMMFSGCVFTIRFIYKPIDVVRDAGILGSLNGEDKSIAKNKTAFFISRQVCENEITKLSCIVP